MQNTDYTEHSEITVEANKVQNEDETVAESVDSSTEVDSFTENKASPEERGREVALTGTDSKVQQTETLETTEEEGHIKVLEVEVHTEDETEVADHTEGLVVDAEIPETLPEAKETEVVMATEDAGLVTEPGTIVEEHIILQVMDTKEDVDLINRQISKSYYLPIVNI